MPSSCLDFLEALSKRGRTCSNLKASRKANGVDANHVRTKATHRANSKKGGRYSVVRSCSCTLKGMVLSLEVALSGAHMEPIKLSTDIA